MAPATASAIWARPTLTRVNGAIVQEAALADGDQIQLGDSALRFAY